jgi:hypothetical protein
LSTQGFCISASNLLPLLLQQQFLLQRLSADCKQVNQLLEASVVQVTKNEIEIKQSKAFGRRCCKKFSQPDGSSNGQVL